MAGVGHLNVGCRLNSCETEWLAAREARRLGVGIVEDLEAADVIVLGTCCVTARSQSKSRKAARRLLTGTGARIILTGCAARLFPGDYPEDPRLTREFCPEEPLSTPCGAFRSRGQLKIQDGCSNSCAYCAVPLARGPSRSFDRDEILQRADSLAEAGFREVVLTGVDIASYGADRYGSSYGLAELLRDLLEPPRFRVRLGSLEPMRLGDGFLSGLALRGVCRHLHLSFQSASTRVLSLMGRACTAEDVVRLSMEARRAFPGCILGGDLITGFPGERDEDFAETMRLLDPDHGLMDYAHVFPFSPRPGTRAGAASGKRCPGSPSKERADALRAASKARRTRYARSQAGEELEVLVESRRIGGRLVGLSDNYVTVRVPAGSKPGELVRMRPSPGDILTGVSEEELL